MRRQLQESGMQPHHVADTLDYDGLHVVVEATPRDAAERFKCTDVPTDDGGGGHIETEVDEDGS